MLINRYTGKSVSEEEAINDLFYVDPYDGGTIEQLGAKVCILENLLQKLLLRNGITADQVNELYGWRKYGETE